MFYKIKCPVCGAANSIGIFRSKFSTKCCECESKLFIDGRMANWIELFMFIPIYLVVVALGEAIIGKYFGVRASYWHLYPFLMVVAWIFHGFAFPKLMSVTPAEN